MPKLPYDQAHFNAAQNSIIQELFVRTADENYITARWCAAEGLHTDFLWLATHALEKYMKAILLLNGGSAMKDGHDTPALFERVDLIASDLLPNILDRPANLDIPHWRPLAPKDFIDRLYRNGNADNRYLILGYVTQSQDLHMLDSMVCALRRLICRLDDLYIHSDREGAPDFTNRTLLTQQPTYKPSMGLPLDDAIRAKKPSPREHAALNLNMAFAPDNYPHTAMRGGTSSRNPVLLRRIIDPLNSDDVETAKHGITLAAWLLANVKLPGSKKHPSVVQEIEAAIAAAKLRHKLP